MLQVKDIATVYKHLQHRCAPSNYQGAPVKQACGPIHSK